MDAGGWVMDAGTRTFPSLTLPYLSLAYLYLYLTLPYLNHIVIRLEIIL